MILIGQYDSPFVRRVGIALRLYGIGFEHRPWSAFGDHLALGAVNPLMRVPTLILNDGFVLSDSHMMLDYLDGQVARPLFPREEPARHRALKIAALACGMADKAVSLFYERRMHAQVSKDFDGRCRSQIAAVLRVLETDLAAGPRPFWFAEALGHCDIAVACALRFVRDAHPGLIQPTDFPILMAFAQNLEAMPVFEEISQAFVAPT